MEDVCDDGGRYGAGGCHEPAVVVRDGDGDALVPHLGGEGGSWRSCVHLGVFSEVL